MGWHDDRIAFILDQLWNSLFHTFLNLDLQVPIMAAYLVLQPMRKAEARLEGLPVEVAQLGGQRYVGSGLCSE